MTRGVLVLKGLTPLFLGRIPSNKQSLQIEKTLIIRFVQQIESWRFFPLFTRKLQFFHLKKLVPSVKAALTQILM